MALSRVSIFKRSNGIWYILYTQDGRRRWKSAGTTVKSEALAQIGELKNPPKEEPKTQLLSEFTKEFLAYAETTYARATRDIYRVCLRHLQRIVHDRPLRAIDQRHVDLYKADRLRTKSPVSVNVELRGLRTILNYALRWKLIESNPFARVQLLRIPEMPPMYFTKEEFGSLLTVIDQEWLRRIVIFTVSTGMRRGEVLNLQWPDVDLTRRLAHIHSTPTFKSKWGKQRVIPLNDQMVQMLANLPREEGTDYVFTFEGRKVAEDYLSHIFTEYVRAAGISKRLHFHSLRHTHATWLVQQGTSIYEIQKLLGHASIEMTQVYSHLAPESLHHTVNKLKLELDTEPTQVEKEG